MKKIKAYKCTDCKEISYLEDNGEIRVGFCKKCGHPLWNPANDEDDLDMGKLGWPYDGSDDGER